MAKKRKPNTIRTSISVPRGLKGRMDRVTEDVNWSALACQAFQDKLDEIAARKETKTMEDVVERLRASIRHSGSHKYRQGHNGGVEWAKSRAEAVELQRLADFADQHLSDWESQFVGDPRSPASASERLFFVMRPERAGHKREAEEFWDSAIGNDQVARENRDCEDYLQGFADGAIEVWNEVEGQVLDHLPRGRARRQ